VLPPQSFHPKAAEERKRARALTKWTVPPKGRLKLNFDGAAKGNLGPLGAGVIIRNEVGNLVVAMSKKLLEGTNNEAKFEALLLGLRLCKDFKFMDIDIKGDSLIYINAIKSKKIHNWKLKYIADAIWTILPELGNCTLNHIYQEGNSAANFLANSACEQVEDAVIAKSCDPWPCLPL